MWRMLAGTIAAMGAGLALAGPAEALSPGLPDALSVADGREVDIAYDSDDDELVVIWLAKHPTASGDVIWAQRFTGAGAAIGQPEDVLYTGGSLRSPAIEYVPQYHLYYLAWVSSGGEQSAVTGKRITHTLSNQGGPFAISGAGTADPDVVGVDLAQRWGGNMWVIYDLDAGSPGVAEDEHEIYRKVYSPSRDVVDGQRRISETGADGDASVDATAPAVSWSDRDSLYYLMAWNTPDGVVGQVHWEVNGVPGVIREDFPISTAADARDPAIAYSPQRKQWMVVYTSGGRVLGRLIRASDGAIVRSEIDFTQDADANAKDPAVAWNADGDEWAVTWSGTSAKAPGEREIYLQRVPGVDGIIRDDAPLLRMSVMGPSGDAAREALRPAVLYAPTAKKYLTAWEADHDADDLFRTYATLGQAAEEPEQPLFGNPAPGPSVAVVPDPGAPPPPPSPPAGTTRRSSAGLPGGTTIDLPAGDTSLGVKVACGIEAACAGTVSAETIKAYASAKSKRKPVALGRTRFALAAGKTKIIKVKLSKAARTLLAKQHVLKARITVALDGGATTKRTVTIKVKAKKRAKR